MMQEKVSFVPVSRKNLERAKYPNEILDALVCFPGTFATGFYRLQNAVLFDQGAPLIGWKPFVRFNFFRLYSRTQGVLSRVIGKYSTRISLKDNDFVAVMKDVCEDRVLAVNDDDHYLSFMKVWVEYDASNSRFLVGYLDTALEDFRNRVYRTPKEVSIVELRYWLHDSDFVLSDDFQAGIVRTALTIPGFEVPANDSRILCENGVLDVVKDSAIRLIWSSVPPSGELYFYLRVREALVGNLEFSSSTGEPSMGYVVSEKFLSLFGEQPMNRQSGILNRVNKVAVALGEKLPPRFQPTSYHYDFRLVAGCALYPVIASVETVKERFHVLNFFARGCETLTPGSLSYDDIVCAWKDNAIPWDLPPTVGMQFVAGYARDLEDTPSNRMKNFAMRAGEQI